MSREEDANRLADDLESLRTGTLQESEFRAKCQAAVPPNCSASSGRTLSTTFPIPTFANGITITARCKMPKWENSSSCYELAHADLADIHFLGYS